MGRTRTKRAIQKLFFSLQKVPCKLRGTYPQGSHWQSVFAALKSRQSPILRCILKCAMKKKPYCHDQSKVPNFLLPPYWSRTQGPGDGRVLPLSVVIWRACCGWTWPRARGREEWRWHGHEVGPWPILDTDTPVFVRKNGPLSGSALYMFPSAEVIRIQHRTASFRS